MEDESYQNFLPAGSSCRRYAKKLLRRSFCFFTAASLSDPLFLLSHSCSGEEEAGPSFPTKTLGFLCSYAEDKDSVLSVKGV